MFHFLSYQKKALKKCKKLIKKKYKGMLLFHSLGSGKTITTLNIIHYFIQFKKKKYIYIICPSYLFDVWKNESKKIDPKIIKNLVFIDIYNLNNILNIESNKNNIIIFDEAHIIISYYFHSNIIKKEKLKEFYKKCYSCFFTIYITATPIAENITDLYIYENLCSNKKLLTNDKNLYPEYFIINKFLYIFFNKLFPILLKYTFKAPYFTIINLLSTFTIIYLELFHDSLFDEFHKFISYLKYNRDVLGRNILLPIVKNIQSKCISINHDDLDKQLHKDDEYIEYKKKFFNEDIQKKDGELSQDYINLKKNIIKKTRLSYIIKVILGIYYSFITIIELFRNYYLKKYGIIKFNYKKFLKNIYCVDKYIVSESNNHFPTQKINNIYITLNKIQTQNIVQSIVNKNYIYNQCNDTNYILCNLYNIVYDDIPINKILQISNFFDSYKFNELLKIINIYKTNIVISCRHKKNSFDLVILFLKKYNISFQCIEPNKNNTLQIIENFQQKKFQILILHPDIIEGISIMNSKAIILFDVCTKYNIEQQVIGRVIRFNSHKKSEVKHVDIFKFITVFDKNILLKELRQINDPSQSFEELLNDKNKIKFLSLYKSPDQIFEESNLLIKNLYDNL